MISAEHLGRRFGPYVYPVERERISQLAAAVGELHPIYHDRAAAQSAGLPDLPAPPTLATCYGLWANVALLHELAEIHALLPRMLHGEQHYTYHTPVYAGDTLTATSEITSIVHKHGQTGPFDLLTLETQLVNQHGALAITDRLVAVVRPAYAPLYLPPLQPPQYSAATPLPGATVLPPVTEVAPGVALPTFHAPPLLAEDMLRYAAASLDYNPLHTDAEYAHSLGMEGVIAHGMLVMGQMARLATALGGPLGLRSFNVRFLGPTHPGDTLGFGGMISAVDSAASPQRVEAELWAMTSDATPRARGVVQVALAE
ncbi:MaoC domain protein dehydratase [Oscillochloris trichoides DG-6]|uniref:MaoC domain protein dehydratase n=1 Tax=Oscillochloris trichoides DG-6 TaxID=765420 RepID=E1IIR1_9CHLR|nr:MaoC family dehydratase N-terminal domain-containing protein [Oscillochloris trichoides]EFO78917.1 MaoC domain protein dehydratase [Oscillochloris trichoides DG-6]